MISHCYAPLLTGTKVRQREFIPPTRQVQCKHFSIDSLHYRREEIPVTNYIHPSTVSLLLGKMNPKCIYYE